MLLKVYLALMLILSLIEFILFAIDKKLSENENSRRIPEITLLSLCNFGGSLGCLIAMKLFRHKTVFKTKFHFTVSVYLSLAIHIALLFTIGWLQL